MQDQTSSVSATSEQWILSWRNFLALHPLLNIIGNVPDLTIPNVSAEHLAEDDDFWDRVGDCFPTSKGFINLNNGAVSSSALVVEKAYTTYYSLVNSSPSYFIWKEMEPVREIVREGLAHLINASIDEVTMLRNTTEAMNNVIFGIDFREGDEVVVCKQDYAKTVSSWKQRELRDKIKIVWVEIDGTETNEEVVTKYVSAFSSKTKLLQVTHVINWNGQVLPIEIIIREAKKKNIQVFVDAAHSFGILETDVKKLDCEYLVATLHKWLSGPVTAGMLYIRKDKIATTWPLASSVDPLSSNIRKFEELSIQLLPNTVSLGYAIEFHLKLGRMNKLARVKALRRYWVNQVKPIDSIKFMAPLNEDQSAVIVNITIDNWEPSALERELFQKYGIHVTAVLWDKMEGVRITPNIYTRKGDLQALVNALKKITG